MSVLSKLFLGSPTATAVDAVGNAIDKIFTSDEEKLQAEAVLLKLRQEPHILQAEINKVEAGHRSIFVAGWRPAIGWICAIGLAFPFLINPTLQWLTGETGPEMPLDAISELVIAMLGMGLMRTAEKSLGKSK